MNDLTSMTLVMEINRKADELIELHNKSAILIAETLQLCYDYQRHLEKAAADLAPPHLNNNNRE